ncbi:hypothetical protein B0H14DRAFT_915019 [Mycena olivaceomarginata]|nr:hypothetical protein B0H14DRAFT_915019 [Mycena olivaceomarginata]
MRSEWSCTAGKPGIMCPRIPLFPQRVKHLFPMRRKSHYVPTPPQLVRKPHSRHYNIAILSPNSDVPLEIRVHIHSLYEKAKPEILHQNQTLEGLIQATTALFTEIWKSAPVLNLEGIRGARKALRWCFDSYCILQAPWSVVKLKVHVMGFPGIRGFGIVASVPLLAGEYIYDIIHLKEKRRLNVGPTQFLPCSSPHMIMCWLPRTTCHI